MGTEWRRNVAGNSGKPVRLRLKVCPKSQGVKQRVRSRGKEVTKGSPRWPGGCGAMGAPDVRPQAQVGWTWAAARLLPQGTG